MYAVIRKFPRMQSHACRMWRRRAETGLGPILKRQPGIYGYYIVRFGEGGGSISLFDSAETAEAAHQQALGWIKENLAGLGGGIEPEVSMGEVLGHVSA